MSIKRVTCCYRDTLWGEICVLWREKPVWCLTQTYTHLLSSLSLMWSHHLFVCVLYVQPTFAFRHSCLQFSLVIRAAQRPSDLFDASSFPKSNLIGWETRSLGLPTFVRFPLAELYILWNNHYIYLNRYKFWPQRLRTLPNKFIDILCATVSELHVRETWAVSFDMLVRCLFLV